MPDQEVLYVAARNFAFAAGAVVVEDGAVESCVIVNELVAVFPALSKTVTVFDPLSVAAVVHVYAWEYGEDASSVLVVGVKPPVRPGKRTLPMPECWSVGLLSVTVNVPPPPAGR